MFALIDINEANSYNNSTEIECLSRWADTLKIWHFSQFVGWQVGEQQKNSTVKPHIERRPVGRQQKNQHQKREKVVRKGSLFKVMGVWKQDCPHNNFMQLVWSQNFLNVILKLMIREKYNRNWWCYHIWQIFYIIIVWLEISSIVEFALELIIL